MCQTWAIAQAITNTLLLMVKQCVLKQNQEFRLISNALASIFILCILLKFEVAKI
jgi:hypothetical protein